MDQKNKESKKPWYKYPMVWFVISLPLTAVVASIITLVIASNNAPQIINKSTTIQKSGIEPTKK